MAFLGKSIKIIKQFKSNAWKTRSAAERYDVNVSNAQNLQTFCQINLYLEKIAAHLRRGEKILDVGCGTGALTLALDDAGYRVSGMDISETMLDRLRPKLAGRTIDLHVGNAFDLPFTDESFDAIASRWVLPHFPDWPRIVMEAARKLRPGGHLFFDFCNQRNVELAETAGQIDPETFGFSNAVDPKNKVSFYATADDRGIAMVAATAGLELVHIKPNGFFVCNAAIAAALGREGYEAYKAELDRHYENPGAKAFLEWFERDVSPKLPDPMIYGNIVVMRRPVDA